MKAVFFSFFILMIGSARLTAESQETPPLVLRQTSILPLTEEFPLGLNQANRNFLMEKTQNTERTREIIQSELDRRSFPWLTVAMILVCGGAGWFLYLMRDQLIERKIKTLPELSPIEDLRKALEAIKKKKYAKENCSEYYNALSTLILQGIELRSGWNTSSMTTIEIAQRMQRQSLFPPAQTKKLLSLLITIDEVKFSGEHPSEEQAMKTLQTGIEILDPLLMEEWRSV